MLFKRKTDWDLLAKFVAGETDSKETESVLSWAEKNPENKALLQDIKSDWLKMDIVDDRFDVDNAWKKLYDRIDGDKGRVIEMPAATKYRSMIRIFSIPVRIAAAVVLLAILSVAVITSTGKLQRTTITTSAIENNRVVEMPDGSKVYLNGGTKFSYSKKYGKNNRNVSLSGEAFFEVSPDKTIPFRIYAGDACITVVGTSFNVNTTKTVGVVQVYVESGIVELSENGNFENNVLVHPGNIGTIDHRVINTTPAGNSNSIAWKTGDMTFSDAPLLEVIDLLNDVYNVRIKVEGEGIDTIRINGSYDNDPLDDILRVIGQHNPQITIAKSDDTIYLSQ